MGEALQTKLTAAIQTQMSTVMQQLMTQLTTQFSQQIQSAIQNNILIRRAIPAAVRKKATGHPANAFFRLFV